MLSDITIGQYYPANSIIHFLDPRIKIIITIWYLILLFSTNNPLSFAILSIFILLIIMLSKIPMKIIFKSIKPLFVFILITAFINAFMTNGKHILWQFGFLKLSVEGLKYSLLMIVRIVLLILGTSMITYTTKPISLTDGIEKLLQPLSIIKIPSHEIAMMMTIALRFIPTLIEETDKIIKAQKARGADFESKNLFKKTKSLIPLLVPLFVSAFRRADELAVAMECKCYTGGKNRTRLHVLKVSGKDYISIIVMILLTSLIGLLNILF